MYKLPYTSLQEQLATSDNCPLNLNMKRHEHHVTSIKDQILMVKCMSLK